MKNLKAHFESFIIGIFFIGISALVGWMLVVEPIREHYRTGQWDRISATISSVNLQQTVNPKNTVTSYECQASYHYTVGGKAYEASNVSIYRGSDNLSNFQHRIFRELSRHKKSGRPFQVYVNPQNPQEAILYRNLRWGVTLGVSLLVLLFCSAGVALLIKTANEFFSELRNR